MSEQSSAERRRELIKRFGIDGASADPPKEPTPEEARIADLVQRFRIPMHNRPGDAPEVPPASWVEQRFRIPMHGVTLTEDEERTDSDNGDIAEE